jgi:hypothetical protein
MTRKAKVSNFQRELARRKVRFSALLFDFVRLLRIVHLVTGQRTRQEEILRLDVTMNQFLSP